MVLLLRNVDLRSDGTVGVLVALTVAGLLLAMLLMTLAFWAYAFAVVAARSTIRAE